MIAPVINIASARKPTLTPAELLTRLRIEGLRVYLKDGSLFVGPQSAVTAEQRKLIREHRDGLIGKLIAEKDADIELLQRDLKASEDKRTHAETLLELTRIQLGIEREYGSIRRSQPALPPIPEDIRRFIASRCHPDHNQDSEVSTRAMAWLNAVPREARP